MRRNSALLCVAVLLAGPAWSQGFGQAPGGSAPSGYGQPGQADGFGSAQGGPSILGAWSGQHFDQGGTIQQTDAFSPDGKFVSVARLPNGFLARTWGYYRASPAGPNQVRVDLQAQGWLPQQVCRQVQGAMPDCQPFQIPANDTVLVTFTSPNSFQSVSQTMQGASIAETRDPNPFLLQAQAPQRWTINVVPAPQTGPGPAPVGTPYVSPFQRGPATNIPGLGGNCDDLQQQRICNINDGTLVRGRDGCMKCLGR